MGHDGPAMLGGDQIRAVCNMYAGRRQGHKVGTVQPLAFFGLSQKDSVPHHTSAVRADGTCAATRTVQVVL